MNGRWVIVGLAHPRAPWFADVGRWANSGSLAIEFLRCVSGPEARAHLTGGRAVSALLVDASLDADRDLIELASAHGAAVIAVADPRRRRDWSGLGVTVQLEPDFGPDDLASALEAAAPLVDDLARHEPDPLETGGSAKPSGRLIGVVGGGGVGVSTVAASLAQELARDEGGGVCLADFALTADQAIAHDARDLVPGVQELAEAHRHGSPAPERVREMTFAVPNRGYRLLLGLRRPHDWTALRSRSVEAATRGLLNAFDLVVADLDAVLEGEAQTGSLDVEERHVLARTAAHLADVIVVVGRSDLLGVHRQLTVVRALLDHGVEGERIVLVANLAHRRLGVRASVARALDELAPSSVELTGPVHIRHHRSVADAVADTAPLPPMARPLARVTRHLLGQVSERSPSDNQASVPVVAGSLGVWANTGEASTAATKSDREEDEFPW